MRAASKSRHVNYALVEDQLQQDRERRKEHNKKWRRRWILGCCCCCLTLGSTSAAGIFVLALSSWTLLSEACGWAPRRHFGAVFTPSGSVFVVGGTDGTSNFGDVWTSDEDGEEWKLVVNPGAFGHRHGHALVCDGRNGDLFVIAGSGGNTMADQSMPLRDVWRSRDGRDWTLQTDAAPWAARKYFSAVMDVDGRLFIAGGLSGHGTGGLNDIWSSDDAGRTWASVALAAPWSGRYSFSLALLPGGTRRGRIYIFGGTDGRAQHDVWASDDRGSTWQLMRFTHTREMRQAFYEDRASWTPRFDFSATADGHGMVTVLGGKTDLVGEDAFSNEVWKLPSPQIPATDWYNRKNNDDRLNADTQPLTWEATSIPLWKPRRGHQAIVDKEGVAYILGGETADGLVNDFWKWEQSLDLTNLQQSYEEGIGGTISGIIGR